MYLGKDLLLHVNILVPFVICFKASVKMGQCQNFLHVLSVWINQEHRDARPVTDLKEHKIIINAVNLNRPESSRTPNFNPRPLWNELFTKKEKFR